jgi:hypothetical protein
MKERTTSAPQALRSTQFVLFLALRLRLTARRGLLPQRVVTLKRAALRCIARAWHCVALRCARAGESASPAYLCVSLVRAAVHLPPSAHTRTKSTLHRT